MREEGGREEGGRREGGVREEGGRREGGGRDREENHMEKVRRDTGVNVLSDNHKG